MRGDIVEILIEFENDGHLLKSICKNVFMLYSGSACLWFYHSVYAFCFKYLSLTFSLRATSYKLFINPNVNPYPNRHCSSVAVSPVQFNARACRETYLVLVRIF